MTGERDRPVRSREKRKKEKREKRIARPHYIPKVIHIQITEYELKISTRENKKKSLVVIQSSSVSTNRCMDRKRI